MQVLESQNFQTNLTNQNVDIFLNMCKYIPEKVDLFMLYIKLHSVKLITKQNRSFTYYARKNYSKTHFSS